MKRFSPQPFAAHVLGRLRQAEPSAVRDDSAVEPVVAVALELHRAMHHHVELENSSKLQNGAFEKAWGKSANRVMDAVLLLLNNHVVGDLRSQVAELRARAVVHEREIARLDVEISRMRRGES